jgi:hypothetical protein
MSFQPNLMFANTAGAYPIEPPSSCSALGQASLLTHKQTRLEILAKDKHSSLIQTLVNYGSKNIITLGLGVNPIKLFMVII